MNICQQCGNEFQAKRKEQRFCSVPCRQRNNGKGRAGQKTGLANKPYKARLTKDGHLRMYAAKHPFAEGRKEMMVHDMLMETHLGRRLAPTECVHHKNEDKTDNRLENLELMTHAEHSALHNRELAPKRKRKGGRFA